MDSNTGKSDSSQEKTPDLEAFREEWKRELAGRSEVQQGKSKGAPLPPETPYPDDDVHIKAREFFQHGVQLEQNGKLYDAIKFYKKAVNLVPDIEKEAFYYTGRQAANKEKNTSGQNGESNNKRQSDEALDTEEDIQNLVDKFSQINLDNKPLIQSEFNSQSKHIGELPVELLNYILKWVVSKELDLRSLESCSEVCRGFYLAARDQEIWRQVCIRVFGASVLQARPDETPWRDYYLSRSRILFHGCYVSKMTYIREGERSFQDHESYRAWHMVEYFRLIRFFPGGRMLMCISAEDPGLTAKMMNNKNFCSVQGSMFGEYRIQDNLLVCVLHKTSVKKIIPKFRKKRRDAGMIYNDVPDQDFLIEFVIKGSRSRTLQWKAYNIVSKYSSGNERNNSISLNDSNYPRLKFASVGSYHFESTSPL